MTEQVELTNISHFNNSNISLELPNTNQKSVPYLNYNKHIYILYSITTFIAALIFIIIIFKIKKHICVDSKDNKVVSLNRKLHINNDIPKEVKIASKKKRKKNHSSI